jgi:glycosyltransferase involved in cell wall biosynthesis
MSGVVVQAVRSTSFAGVERYICDVSNELVLRGWAVHVIGGDPGRMRRELGTAVSFLPAASTGGLLLALRGLRREGGVWHAHMTAAETAGVLGALPRGPALVSTRHFAGPRGDRGPVRLAGRLVRSRLATQISISRFVADAIGEDSVVLPNAVRDALPSTLSRRRVLVLQRLQPEKDTTTALEAWARSAGPTSGWTLTVAGRGEERPALEARTDELGVSDSVEFVGFVDDPAALRQESSVFLATARAEPFGLSVVEAMAQGLPVVASDSGAHRETVADAGALFPPGDPAACAAALD